MKKDDQKQLSFFRQNIHMNENTKTGNLQPLYT